jgi:hypothetical protein
LPKLASPSKASQIPIALLQGLLHGVPGTLCQALKTKGKICNMTQHEDDPCPGHFFLKSFDFQWFMGGWGTRIRT